MFRVNNQQHSKQLSKQFRLLSILFIYCILFGSIHILYVNGVTQDEIINDLQSNIQNLQGITQKIQESIKNACPLNSYLKNGLCYCTEGLVWNERGTECITYNQACQNKYVSHVYGDKHYCYCDEGYTWNKEKTKCITALEWCYSIFQDEHITAKKEGSEYRCYCIDGYIWNNDQKKCVSHTEDCQLQYGKHVIGRGGDAQHASNCDCEEGYVWNFKKTTCITKWESIKQYFVGGGISTILLISILLGLIPILIWSFVFLITIKKIFRKHISLKWVFIFLGIGILITPLIWYGEGFYLKLLRIDMNASFSLLNIIFVYGGIAVIEEIAKFFSAYFVLKRNKYFDEAIDAMIYLIVLALGFGLVENILAASQEIVEGGLLLPVLQTMSLRFVGANLLHALSSGVIGFFWALSLLKNKKPYLYWGLVLGISLHFFFNLVTIKFGGTAVFLVSLALIALLILFLNDFKKLSNLLQKSFI